MSKFDFDENFPRPFVDVRLEHFKNKETGEDRYFLIAGDFSKSFSSREDALEYLDVQSKWVLKND